MVRELGPILRDYDIQHLLDDVDDAVYAGVLYELPSELVDQGQQGQGQSGQEQGEPDQPEEPVREPVEESVLETVQKEENAPEDLPVGYPFPTPPDSSFHVLAQADTSFHAEIRKGITYKLHRSQLQDYPPPHFRSLQSHRFADQWRQAMETEYSHLAREKVLQEVPVAEAQGRILDLMWVFDYKYTEEGYLDRFKARLVVRGDQMW